MIFFRMRSLFRNIKYSFLKYFNWHDAFHSFLLKEGDVVDLYVYGKKYFKCTFCKSNNDGYQESIGLWPYFFKFADGSVISIHSPDMILFLPWIYSKQGIKYSKDRKKVWDEQKKALKKKNPISSS